MEHYLLLLCAFCIAVAPPVVTLYPDGDGLEVRLVNGKTKFQGRLEVRRNESESWGTVCDDGFDQNDAKVVCRMLNFTNTEHATYFKEPSPYGPGTGHVLLDQIGCIGTETNLAQCNNSGWDVSDCHHNEDVGVNCQTPIRLIGSPHSGIVEILSNNTWKPLCYDETNENIGTVLCRMLALSAGNVFVKAGQPSNEVYHASHPMCTGKENDISQCFSTKTVCSQKMPVYLNCRTEIRLQGGTHNQSGRVEVFFQNRWGTICDDSFEASTEESATSVICGMLGFKTKGAVHRSGAINGKEYGDVLIDKLMCKGDENDIADCDSKQWGSHTNCLHSEDVWVECGTDVRLVGGPTPFSGRLEIHHGSQWKTMCDASFDNITAQIICNMLGFPRGNVSVHGGAYYGQGTGEMVDYALDCDGNETDIVSCRHENRSTHCDHSQDVGINCYSVTPIRLQGGPTSFSGRVEIWSYAQQHWTAVCDPNYGFTKNDAKVLCNMMGKPNNSPTYQQANELYDYVILGEGIADIRCKGTEKDITDCVSGRSWNRSTCDNPHYVGINCDPDTHIRLVDGNSSMIGRVEIQYNNTWGSICWNGYNGYESYLASVVCKKIGSRGNAKVLSSNELRETNTTTIINSIQLDCSRYPRYPDDISNCKSTPWNTNNQCLSRTYVEIACESQVRLVNGTSARSGRVEVFVNDSWKSVCAAGFNENAGNVVCRKIGLNVWNVSVLSGNYFGRGEGEVYLNSTNCTGQEEDLIYCRSGPWEQAECEDDEVAAIDCQYWKTELRLVNSETPYSGRVEVFFNHHWGTVCENSFTLNDATVVCRKLGYNFSTNPSVVNDPYDGNFVHNQVIVTSLSCNGYEDDISMCSSLRWDSGYSSCSYSYQSVGVNCLTSVRLSGGIEAMGQVEVMHGGTWRTICNDNFVETNIPVLCFMLGFNYTQNYKIIKNRFHTSYADQPTIQNLTCTGKEVDIQQCRSSRWGMTSCSHRNAAAISCNTPVQLIGEDSWHRGKLQIWSHDGWMDVCYNNNTVEQTQVGNIVCRMLGLKSANVRLYPVEGSQINAYETSCSGYEKDISQCNLTTRACPPNTRRLAISCDIGIRLENGRTEYMGAVSVLMFGRWGRIQTIKNDNTAKLACKNLGFKFWNKAEVQKAQDFRNSYCPTLNILVLDCTGNETDIMMCDNTYLYLDQYSYSCSYSGVNCQTPVRLSDGSQYQYGRIEVKNNGSWYQVCSEHFSIESAYVFCRMLGHKHVRNATFRHDEHTRYNETMVVVKCNGSEVDVSECENLLFETCPSGEAVHLDCRSTVRIVDGPTPFIGRVEVFFEGRWGTISKTNSASSATLQVLCKILGLNYIDAQVYNRPNVQTISRMGVTNHTINSLQCVGTEEDITECSSEPWMSQTEYYDTGALEIACLNPIRLVDGSNANIGQVRVSYNNIYLSVCGDNFTQADADVVCRKIGVETNKNATIYFNNMYGSGYSYVISNIQCLGNESDIQACQSDQWFNSSNLCNPRNNAVSVNCRPRTPIRFQGSSNYTGVVEINYNGNWGTICYAGFDQKDAYVICRMLGFKSNDVISFNYQERTSITRNLQCQGYEKDISECSHSDYSWYNGLDCNGDSSTDQIATVTCSDNWVRLQGGVNDYQGRIEIQYIGLTMILCDTYFDAVDADVVCRHFGFHYGNRTIYKAGVVPFGRSSSYNMIIDDLNCTGREDDVDKCSSYPWSSTHSLCNSNSGGAGVNCRPITPIRLVNGTNAFSGRLEIAYKGSYGTVCDRNFDEQDAQVVCRMLGYNTLSTVVQQRAFFGQGTGKISVSHLNCNGNEPDISECKADYRWDSPYAYCEHSDDVSVHCDTPVRLHGGWTAFSGSVEVYINGSWQSVCLNGFTQKDAVSICSITGLTKDFERDENVTIHKESYYGIRSKQTVIGNLKCTGEEVDLFYCGAAKWTTQPLICNADDNVAINCRPSTSIRLMNAAIEVNLTNYEKGPVSGRVEVQCNNKWGTICDDQFDDSDALVICKMMGFSVGHVDRVTDHGKVTGTTPVIVDDLECLGTEDDISECKAREWGTHNCDHDEDISVICDDIENIDPCKSSEHVRLPNLEFRHLNTNTSTLKTAYNDSKLPVSWYYVGTNAMPNKPPPFNSCGTHFPIYSTDKLPQLGETKTIKATQVGDETISYNILVKTCNKSDHEEYVYKLEPTRNDQSGYCFGIGSVELPPSFIANEVSTFIRNEPYEISFGCKFTLSDEDLLYQVFWYIEGNYEHSFTKQYFNRSRLLELDLIEDDFHQLGIGLGIDISCAVRAFKTEDGQPGPMSDRSPPLFAGIEVLTPSITLRKGETKSIEIKNTMPLVCDQTVSPGMCTLRLELFIPHDNTCSNSIAAKYCYKRIYNTSYQDISTIDITTTENSQYGVRGHFKVNLQVRPNNVTHLNIVKFWKRQYKLPEIAVHVLPEADKTWRGTLCTAQNDPHMHTFDGKTYEHHEEIGEYILYRHRIFNNIEIQHKIASCIGTNSVAKCNCGVAVRSGRDVYVINVCERLLDIGYKLCEDQSLTVKKINDFTYTIYLPYGTAIRARIDNQPMMGNEGGRVVDISVLPSVYDNNGNSSGLCGTLNNDILDDFTHRNGSLLNSISGHKLFINSWKVHEDESLFSFNVNRMTLTPWSFPSCVCRKTDNDDEDETDNVTCARSVTECSPGVTSGQHSCGGVSDRRPIRSVDKHSRIPVVMQTDHYAPSYQNIREKRAADMVALQPRRQCETYFQDLQAFELCQKVPATHTNISVENCVLDIELTNSTLWMTISRQSMQDACLTEIHRNASVREEVLSTVKNESIQKNSNDGVGTTISPVQLTAMLKEIEEIETIVEQIAYITCLNNCSGHGQCLNGTCDCEKNFGATDCSLDINKPPRIEGILDNGLCDEKDHDCSHIYVFGEVFAGTNLTCRLERFTMKPGETKTRNTTDSYTLKGTADSLIEAICPIHQLRSKRSISNYEESPNDFVYGFRVTVSNDGNTFGDQTEDVYIFDSTCQAWSNSTGEMIFSLKDGHCYINGRCVSNGTVSMELKAICDTEISRFSWTEFTTLAPSTPTSATTTYVVGTSGGNLCESYVASHPCASDESCVVEKEEPICKKKDSASDTSNLITIISSSVSGILILGIIILVACLCRSKMKNRRSLNARQSSAEPNINHDMSSTEMLERPRKTFEKSHTYVVNPQCDRRASMSDGSYYKDGNVYDDEKK